MKTGMHWQRIAERLAEAGFSWTHRTRIGRNRETMHVAEAHDEKGQIHFAFAKTVGPAFVALERSVKSVGK